MNPLDLIASDPNVSAEFKESIAPDADYDWSMEKQMTFKNKNFTARDYECTNVVACVAQSAPDENWVLCDESILDRLNHLEAVAGVRYYGWL